MKLFKNIKEWLDNQEHLFYVFLVVLIVPNVALCFTESLPVVAKVCNVLLPLSVYYWIMTWSRNCGKAFWGLFLFLFFGAFQIVLLYLFGQSIIAVDMFLNLMTTNASEALELLDNLVPALVTVFVVYIPALVLGMISIVRKRKVSVDFIRRQRKRAYIALGVGFLSLGAAYLADDKYELTSDLYPVNVCYNVALAFERNAQTRHYPETSKDFTFQAVATHPAERAEVYVLVVGETSRALNWQLYGYERETNPSLKDMPGMVAFPRVLTESNTTHKSVPMLLSAVSARDYDSLYYQKGVITAFREAGFRTAFFSNQRHNRSFIDFFGMEADTYDFIKEDVPNPHYNPSDTELLALVEKELEKGVQKLFIVLHTYGSHFNYRERYPAAQAFFLPDSPVDAEMRYRDNLINAYDNSIRETDVFLARLIRLLGQRYVDVALLYTSDHGEDIFDDDRRLFLHASPVPSYYQLHVPFVAWLSDSYREKYPDVYAALQGNREKDISSSEVFFHTVLHLAGVETKYLQDSLSVAHPHFKGSSRVYLDDHNDACSLQDISLKEEDFEMLRKANIHY